MKRCVEKTDAKLIAAVLLTPAVEGAPAPGKKRHTSFVSVQYLATDNRTSILKRFKEDILKDRVKLLDFVQSAFKKEEDEDAPIEGTATEGSERKETDVQMVQEHTKKRDLHIN